MVDRSTTKNSQKRSTKSRRALLVGGSASVFGALTIGTASATESITEGVRTLCSGTRYETPAYVREAPADGPTAVVLGGVHGSELSGIEAAHAVREWQFDQGTLVVIPEANAAAVRDQTYSGPHGDLNQQFPPAQTPTTEVARGIWTFLTEMDPDAVIDLHSSMGIWGSPRGPSGYGQAIFPSVSGNARAVTDRATTSLTDDLIVPSARYGGDYVFTVGNTLAGEHPRLIHKVAVDLECAGYLAEVTRYGTELATRTEWAEGVVDTLLAHHGITATPPK
ncbi:thioredoxin [Natronococcus sp. JC468]|uniref:succinylglutamate desuccinylase/aspartoacylase family protein n=1 Tax=Natronococcus sp. JC468 TaxID=1961921 RepID=UPI001439E708|nr:succinylglutamate desuccinylase/aspartoacylase family protein [Natronococcus sp. JC468]NKE37473.1 thioredoxin [Natronococcus sp. JC468]